MTTRPLIALIGASMVLACNTTTADRCSRYFEPYPDLVSGTARTEKNGDLLDAMALYAKGDHAGAIDGLRAYAEKNPERADVAWFYLANCYLATGKPYDAELQLDFLERWPGRTFTDETGWYNVLCLLCSGQDARALEAAQLIAHAPHHTYKQQAAALASELEP